MSGQPVLYNVGGGQRVAEQTPTVDTNLLLLRILEQMAPGTHMMLRSSALIRFALLAYQSPTSMHVSGR